MKEKVLIESVAQTLVSGGDVRAKPPRLPLSVAAAIVAKESVVAPIHAKHAPPSHINP